MTREIHPRLNPEDLIINKKKIILGSFPSWSNSIHGNFDRITGTKCSSSTLMPRNMQFFFGSSKNIFWKWYQKHVDDQVDIFEISSIIKSLETKAIGITDIILSCERKGASSLDKHLSKREYNHKFLNFPEKGNKLKILCTSKGVMNEMLLNKKFFSIYKKTTINTSASTAFQIKFLSKIKGESSLLKKPFYVLLETEEMGTIECLSIPSPGSPYRKLIDFGSNSDSSKYLDSFISESFKWLML